ncbi:hypothetical protein BpHYR1_012797 [Brachionus plicatilis]|uniref:Uncharacterized protein n=1 Tax=Brachionus plicatilis TaxID=10195 RepID=A0A3M7QS78_BRAPC|nr:hypothetical protein BpHYR1_012797 [Brachionus plicatilis]
MTIKVYQILFIFFKHSSHDHLNDNDDDEETSNLVEDGFIRMSSPVDSGLNNSNNNTNLDSTGLDSTTDLNDIEISNIGFSNVTNFPNVGSSPISDEFLNTSSDADVETFVENAKGTTDFDGIIIHNSSDSNANEITSLSDENAELNDEQDDFGFEGFDKSQIKYLNSQPKAPHSIMKTKGSCLKNNEHGINETSSNSESAELANSSVQVNSSQKPKVRFNLDIDYEKEREWNRINKIIGDASKTQIEWTQEVEVYRYIYEFNFLICKLILSKNSDGSNVHQIKKK